MAREGSTRSDLATKPELPVVKLWEFMNVIELRTVVGDFIWYVRISKRSDEMFAPVPPLLAFRWLVMCNQEVDGAGNMRLMGLDFSKASLYRI